MLASMFDEEPFRTRDSPSPFCFIWDQVSPSYKSAFALEWRDIEERDAGLARSIDRRKDLALLVGKKKYLVRRKDEGDWNVYGVIAAQRRASGQVWVVVSGLSGPATLGSAMALASQHSDAIPESPKRGTHSPVLWALVKTPVFSRSITPGDPREVKRSQVVTTYTYRNT
jgi:hypothetical protein